MIPARALSRALCICRLLGLSGYGEVIASNFCDTIFPSLVVFEVQGTCQQDVIELEVAVDNERLLAVQIRQALAELDAPPHADCIPVHRLREHIALRVYRL